MKNSVIIPALLMLTAGSSVAFAAAEFSDADSNQDGVLSTEEAREALPEVVFVDLNNDGLVNIDEAKRALPMLEISDDAIAEYPDAAIGESEYQLIVQAIESAVGNNS